MIIETFFSSKVFVTHIGYYRYLYLSVVRFIGYIHFCKEVKTYKVKSNEYKNFPIIDLKFDVFFTLYDTILRLFA